MFQLLHQLLVQEFLGFENMQFATFRHRNLPGGSAKYAGRICHLSFDRVTGLKHGEGQW